MARCPQCHPDTQDQCSLEAGHEGGHIVELETLDDERAEALMDGMVADIVDLVAMWERRGIESQMAQGVLLGAAWRLAEQSGESARQFRDDVVETLDDEIAKEEATAQAVAN